MGTELPLHWDFQRIYPDTDNQPAFPVRQTQSRKFTPPPDKQSIYTLEPALAFDFNSKQTRPGLQHPAHFSSKH